MGCNISKSRLTYTKIVLNKIGSGYHNRSCNKIQKSLDTPYSILLEFKILSKITNHPVHVLEETGLQSPTALIPFCVFGGNISVMGVKIDNFDIPFCNSFKTKIIQDQLCYSVDPNKYRNYLKANEKLGLTLFINYNEDREVLHENNYLNTSNKDAAGEDNFIQIETIGMKFLTSSP